MFDELTSVMSLNTVSRNNYELETIYIDKLFVSILQTYEQQAACESRTIDVNLCDEVQSFKQYRVPLERILLNIIDNAIKFTSPGSRIELKVNQEAGNLLVITVSDDGPGIASEHLNRILIERIELKNLKQDYRRVWLGLYIARNLTSNGWCLEVESKINIGSSFILKIPMK